MAEILPFECVPIMALVARLLLPSMRSAGASSARLLIIIRGPNLSQLLAMILSSAAMVSSWPGDAWLMSILNCLVKQHHILFWKVAAEPVAALLD